MPQEYWRIMVPRLLSPTQRCNSIEQKFDETKISLHLIEPLNAFIAGTGYHQDIYQVQKKSKVSRHFLNS
jgi:hypothetical protein